MSYALVRCHFSTKYGYGDTALILKPQLANGTSSVRATAHCNHIAEQIRRQYKILLKMSFVNVGFSGSPCYQDLFRAGWYKAVVSVSVVIFGTVLVCIFGGSLAFSLYCL